MEHHVYFWLKSERDDEGNRKAFEAGLCELCKSSNIESFHWGKPAMTTERSVTDHSFHYAISLKFSSMECHDRYQQNDPIHDVFIENFKDWWEKVLVMDIA